jgi:hypothetical protein
LGDAQAQRRIEAMMEAFPGALVTEHGPLVDTMPNHPKDRHVLAAAVASGAQLIVTQNLRDFPADMLAPFSIEAWSPDAFLQQLFEQSPQDTVPALQKQAAALRNPPKTVEDILEALARHAPTFATRVRDCATARLRDCATTRIPAESSSRLDGRSAIASGG